MTRFGYLVLAASLFFAVCMSMARTTGYEPSLAAPECQASDTVAVDSFSVDTIRNKQEIVETVKRLTDSLSVADSIVQSTVDEVFVSVDSASLDSIVLDSLSLDSLKLGRIAYTDTVATDTTEEKDELEGPVVYSAVDSMVYVAETGLTYLYGDGHVTYQDMELNAEVISMDIDSSLVHAVGAEDSLEGRVVGEPIFKQGEEIYESEKMSYNFKTRKGFIENVMTEQGDGFINSESSKRSGDGIIYLQHAKYTTCDAEEPHFYISLSRAKVKPGKEVIFGPAYLVVADVPLPLAVPFGFFPFNKKYSSGFIMPSYGDDSERGFYLSDGGYYFAISDKMDLKLLGEIYTKGSWGVNAETSYRVRYKYSGNFYINYLNTIEGEKNMPDYSKTTSFKIQWTHRQDSKANPNSSFSASVNFATTSFEQNNLSSLYNALTYSQSTRTSSVSYSYTWSDLGLTIATSANMSQSLQDSTISLTLPEMSITLSKIYPFKRKKAKGKTKWYEKISISYTGRLSNSISTKEDELLHSDLIKDWSNGMSHSIPISATFQAFKYINLTPSFSFQDRMYTNKIMRSWDVEEQEVVRDTIYGFYNVYNWSLSLSANTTLYGFYTPNPKIFGNKIIAVRHLLKPTVSFSYAPDFSTSRYGYYETYVKTDEDGNVSTVEYSPFSDGIYGVPSSGKTGSVTMSLSNNVEMKVRSDKDSTGQKTISIIDELYGSISYNFAAETKQWSDLTTRLRLKLSKNYTFSLSAVFATYAYQFDEEGNVYEGDRTEWSYGRFGRFQGMSQNFSYTFNNSTFRKKKSSPSMAEGGEPGEGGESGGEADTDQNIDPTLSTSRNPAKEESTQAQLDEDGYLKFSIPWTFTISYGITISENTSAEINPKTMRYPYKFTHSLNFSGNIRLAQGWNISYTSGYDFNDHELTTTTASLSRDLHCFSMSCSVVLMPYTSYNFTFRAKISALADVLRWEKRSSYSTNVDWE